MKTTTKIILFTIVLTSILITLGYAAIQNVNLNIAGSATADPNQSNFKVRFVRDVEPTVSDSVYATAGVTDDLNAVLNVNGLNAKGQTIEAIYEIENISTDLSSDLAISVTNSNTEYFRVTSQLASTSLSAGEKTTVTVTVELIKTPLQNVSSTIGVQTIAAPVQPGEEGSSGITNDYSQMPELTLASVSNTNIGDYIDLGKNIIGTEATTDDWRILYKDENAVYVMLTNLLPAEQVPENAGLVTNPTEEMYGVWSDVDGYTLSDGLLNSSAWNSFTNGITGATATGSPTAEMLIGSYNVKNGTQFDYKNCTLDTSSEDFDLYFANEYYWTATPLVGATWFEDGKALWYLAYGGAAFSQCYHTSNLGVRPVVSLPLDTQCKYENNVWKIVD